MSISTRIRALKPIIPTFISLKSFLVNRCKSKFICTLGPASCDPKVIRELILNGMSMARLNFSHCTHEVKRIKEGLN